MEISFVDASSYVRKLKYLFSSCTKLDVAVAYVKISGLKAFLKALNGSPLMKDGRPIRIVFGLSSFHGITDKKSAELLLEVSCKQKNVTVKKYNSPRFHPKMMIFHGAPNRILIGSSNLTAGALSTNAEANVIIDDPDSKFMNDAIKFFETHFDNAPHLKQIHLESYAPRPRMTSRGSQVASNEDELPSRWEPLSPLVGQSRGAGKPNKSLSYYDKRIRDLESKKAPTEQQKRSLAAYRALRTRYYVAPKRTQRLAILQPVTHGKEHLMDVVKEGHGIWITGRKFRKNNALKGGHIYFYENQINQVRYRATIQRIQRTGGKTHLTLFNVEKLKKRRDLRDFKKTNGKNVLGMRGFVYVSDLNA